MADFLRSDDVRNQNRLRILSAVRRAGVASRTEVSHVTGLSAATVSAITSDMISEGLLAVPNTQENSGERTGRGRPKVALTINPKATTICSVYFQLNFVSATIVDYAGQTICEAEEVIRSGEITADQIRKAIISCIESAKSRALNKSYSPKRIEVAFQGVTNAEGSSVLWSPICEERDLPVQQWLEDYFGVPTRVSNDCDMIARALHERDPIRYGDNFAAVLLAHGVGMGLFLRGEIVNGTRSSGVEFGHMTYQPDGALCRCGNRGCIEAYAGDYAISRNAQGRSDQAEPGSVLKKLDLETISTDAANGNQSARAAAEAAGAAIGTGLASIFALVDGFPIVLVGRGTAVFEKMEPAIRKALATAPGENRHQDFTIDCFRDEQPLVREGCALTALLLQDVDMANRRTQSEAAE